MADLSTDEVKIVEMTPEYPEQIHCPGVEMADLSTDEVKIVEMAPEDIITDTLTEVQSDDVPMVGLAAAGAGAGIRGGGGVGAMELGRRLLLAARAGDTALVLDLMAKGAPFTTDWLGTSPLHLAASNDHAATCGVLLRAGVSRDSRTKVERTPLHLAAAAGHTSVVTLLLRHGAAADARDLLRMTPLHWAAQRGHTLVAHTLLKYGADPNVVSKFNKTPMQLAARAGHDELMKLLEDAVRQKEAARSVQALVGERSTYQETNETPQPQTFAATTPTSPDVPEIKSTEHKELPDKIPIQVTCFGLKQTQEKLITEEKETTKTGEDVTDGSGEANAGAGQAGSGAAAILRRHGITLLPPDTGGTVLSALQSGRTVVLSDAGKLMLQESVSSAGNVTVRSPARPTTVTQLKPSPPQVKLIQLPSDARAVRRTSSAAPAPTISKARPPVKIIMNKSNFQRLVAGTHHPPTNAHPPPTNAHPPPTNAHQPPNPPNIAPAPEPTDAPTDDVAELKAQLAASRWTVARLTKELKICRAKLAHYESSASVIYQCSDSQ